MCFFNPKIAKPSPLPPVKKALPTINTEKPVGKKLKDPDDVTKSVKFGDTARAASTAKSVGASDLKININTPQNNQSGGINNA
tara:strand:- start:319 stop:567 length:249 start_codon:yes stop_codon:yes gene_type:complete